MNPAPVISTETRTRTLHICNLANVAYGYCKILDQAGYPVHLRCHDLTHLMSQPEWDDLELLAADFPDENNFFQNTADLTEYRRPDWYLSCGILPGSNGVVAADATDGNGTPHPHEVPSIERAARAAFYGTKQVVPRAVKACLRPFYKRAHFLYRASRAPEPTKKLYTEYVDIATRRFAKLVQDSQRYGPEWTITRQMLSFYQPHAWWMSRHLDAHDAVVAYVMSPIYAMILGNVPYVSVEIGTMRDIPFDGSDDGKLLALAYRRSDHVIITNPDVRTHAQRLGLERYSFCPHPLDEDLYVPCGGESALRRELLARHDAELILFAPARQNWAIKGNDRFFRAFAEIRRQGVKAVLIVPGWGQEIEASQRLCRELGIEADVDWIQPQSERVLVKYYQASDFVLDQFILGVFGLITPKALSCGAVVLTSYDKPTHDWCFDEHPPVVDCRTEADIIRAVTELQKNPGRRRELEQRSREWICRHHSKSVTAKKMLDAVEQAREAFKCSQS